MHEDIELAEANLLPLQSKLSEKRKLARQQLRRLGAEGLLAYHQYGDGSDDDPRTREFSGGLNGHEIAIKNQGVLYTGNIDGLAMSFRHARAVWQKYAGIAQCITQEEIQQANRQRTEYTPEDLEHQQAAELLKDIL